MYTQTPASQTVENKSTAYTACVCSSCARCIDQHSRPEKPTPHHTGAVSMETLVFPWALSETPHAKRWREVQCMCTHTHACVCDMQPPLNVRADRALCCIYSRSGEGSTAVQRQKWLKNYHKQATSGSRVAPRGPGHEMTVCDGYQRCQFRVKQGNQRMTMG